jgi:hypothetical protein
MPDQDVEQKRLDLDRERLNFEREQGQGQVALKNVEQDRKATTLVACALLVVVVGLRLMIRIHHAHAPYLDDDAYYYIIIAKNIALTGLSTFDNQTLTNGYHPLWLLVLVAQYLTLGSSVYVTISIELALSTAGFWLFLTSFRNASALFQVTFALLFAWITTPLIGKGMEVSLLILGMGLFTHLVVEPCETNGASVRLGIAAVLCIGARLDSALFVIPTLLLHLGSVRRSLVALTPVVIAGAIYAAGNFWIFGMPFPISGAVKSLGGLQLNHRFIDQVTSYGHGPGALKAAISFLRSFIGHVVLFFLLSSLGFFVGGRNWKSRPLCAGFIIGCLLYSFKILFFSSWVVWEWYGFPAVLGLATFFHVIDDYVVRTTFGFNPKLKNVATSLAVLTAGLLVAQTVLKHDQNFEEINLEAAAKFDRIFNHARVAMGDRSGSFAAHYSGPVTQLEGMVNDRNYLDALRGRRRYARSSV